MATYAITGTSRGIGLEMVRQLAQAPVSKVKTVIAITRSKDSAALNELVAQSSGRVINVAIPDITSEKSIESALPHIKEALPSGGLDVLINNAGITERPDGLQSLTVETLMDVIKTNVGSVHAVTLGLLPLLQKGEHKTVLNIGSGVGSIALAERFASFKNTAYKTSKAALNMLTRQYALEYEKESFTFFVMSPGWLKTDLGSDRADLTVEDGVRAVLDRLYAADRSFNGKCFNIKVTRPGEEPGKEKYNGTEIPW